ncbi:MAG: POTRA domain-containing protein [Alkalispirochaeta sp.]
MAYFSVPDLSAAPHVGLRARVLAAAALLMVGFSMVASAEERIGARIADISLEGLRKTREEVVYSLLDVEVGDPVTVGLFRTIEESLIDSDLFAGVQVSGRPVGEDEIEVVIVLDEKWTLIPIPFFSTNGSTYQGGMILIETNLLGRNKQLISAGFLGTDGVRGFVAYGDPALFGSNWTGGLSAGAGRNDEERLLPDGTELRSYEYNQQRLGVNLGYNFTRRARISGGLGYERWEIISGESLQDTQFLEPSLTATYDGTRPFDVLRIGPQVRVNGRAVTYRSGWEVAARGEWAFPIAGTHRVRLVGSGAIGEMPLVAEQVISGDGYRTLPFQAVSADSWGSTSAVYDVPIVSAGWGALVLSHFWELGAYTNDDVDPRVFYGPGGGFRVYIRQVAIPALGLDVAYNMPDDGIVFSFSLGAQM